MFGERSSLRTFGLLSLRRRYRLIAACGALFLLAGLLITQAGEVHVLDAVVGLCQATTARAGTGHFVRTRRPHPGAERDRDHPVAGHAGQSGRCAESRQ
jgi:hypothetical protein